MNLKSMIKNTVCSRRAQVLLPAVMLAPIFMLLIYLLFETSKLSMSKVREQFALDNGAYSQMSSASGFLNAVAQVNGPLPYRVMVTMQNRLRAKETVEDTKPYTVFDVFYKAGAFPSIGPNYDLGMNGAISNPRPSPQSTDWGFRYYNGKRAGWMKEEPQDSFDEEDDDGGLYVITDKEIADNYFFGVTTLGSPAITAYATIYIRTGSIYASQEYVYKDTVKDSRMFRQSYYLNTRSCRKSECGREAARTLDRFVLTTKPFEVLFKQLRFYVTADYQGSTRHSGAFPIDFKKSPNIADQKLFQFAYLDGSSRSKLRQLARGITLKQKYKLPANRFNIDVTQRYQPYVRNTVSLSCPRSNNNCVWPNPISKYSVKVGP